MGRNIFNVLLKLAVKKTFSFWQRLGLHVTLDDYSDPIPDTKELKNDLWLKYSELLGIDINEKKQLDLLSLFASKFKGRYDSFPKSKTTIPHEYYVRNGFFEAVDGEILYCIIRHFKPSRIFEIGSGNSTYLSARAILENQGANKNCRCELVAIEPYPIEVLKAGFPGLSRLIPKKVQDIPLSEFAKLKQNDILFIDSSHILKIGSDVQYEYLEILPRLNRGVIVHCHDIFLPSEYRKSQILNDHRFWNEQYLLQAFLMFNDSFEVLWSGSYMHLRYPEKLEMAFASYKRSDNWPASFWMQKTR